MKTLALLILCLIGATSADTSRLTELMAWKTVSFQLGSDTQSALRTGLLVPRNVVPIGVERWKDKLFITTPRFKDGVPATLSYVRLDKLNGSKSPDLIPYPSLEANTMDSKAWPPRLVSVWRVRVDECDRLWAIDSGQTNMVSIQQAAPKIMGFDLKTDKLLFVHTLKYFNEVSQFPSIAVDVTSDNCDHAFAYLPDPMNNRLVVYNLHTNSSHVVTHNYFHFDPLAGDFNYHGYKWQWQVGIYTVALSHETQEGYRIAFFNPLASNAEFTTSTKILQNTSLTLEQKVSSFKVLGNREPGSQSSISFVDDESGVLFYTLINRHAVGCWNSLRGEDYTPNTHGIVAADEDTLTWPSDVVVDKQGNLWVITSSMSFFLFGNSSTTVVNYRVFTATVSNAIKGTVCDEL